MAKSDQTSFSQVDEKLSLTQNLSLGFQHTVIAILAAIPVPLIIASSVQMTLAQTRFFISAIIFSAGLTSILAALNIIPRTSPQIPMIMGASFAVVPVAIAVLNDAPSITVGFQVMAGATIVTGIFCFLIAPFWAKLQRFFPPIVVGTNLMVLGVALLPNAFHWVMDTQANHLSASVATKSFYLTMGVFLFHVIISKYLKGKLANISILISLVVGTIVAYFLGMMDFSSVQTSPWLAANLPLHYGLPKFNVEAILTFLIVMILGMVEVSGTATGIHNIVNKPVNRQQFGKILKTLGLGTFFSGIFNSVQPTAFVPNVGVLDLSKNYSRFVTATAGLMLVLIGFVPKFSALIAVIPKPVLGGIGFAIFGVIIGSAVDILKQVSFKDNQNKLIIGLSIGITMIPATYPNFYAKFPSLVQNILGSGILSGALTAILLNIFFNFKDLKSGK